MEASLRWRRICTAGDAWSCSAPIRPRRMPCGGRSFQSCSTVTGGSLAFLSTIAAVAAGGLGRRSG
eukprot:3474100-Pyramimonas_sp.AAC.1